MSGRYAPVELVLYGITSCDTVRRARAWLDERGIGWRFHDFKKAGLPADRLEAWIAAVGWEALLNRQGLTWKRLDESTRSRTTDAAAASALMSAAPGVVKRPVVEWPDGAVSVGFDAAAWQRRAG